MTVGQGWSHEPLALTLGSDLVPDPSVGNSTSNLPGKGPGKYLFLLHNMRLHTQLSQLVPNAAFLYHEPIGS